MGARTKKDHRCLIWLSLRGVHQLADAEAILLMLRKLIDCFPSLAMPGSKKCRIQLGTNEFLLQNDQNKLTCDAIRHLADGMTAFLRG